LIHLSPRPAISFGQAGAAAQFLWRPPNDSHEAAKQRSSEAAKHVIGIAESEAPGDLLESLMLVLDQRPRCLDAKALSSSIWFEISIKAYISRRVRTDRVTYSSKRPVASRSRSYRLVSGNGGNQDSRRTIQLS